MDRVILAKLLSDLKSIKFCKNFDQILTIQLFDNKQFSIECQTQQKFVKTVVCDVVTLAVTHKEKHLGSLRNTVVSQDDILTCCHPEAFADGYICVLKWEDKIKLYSKKKDFTVLVTNPWRKTQDATTLTLVDTWTKKENDLTSDIVTSDVFPRLIQSIRHAATSIWRDRYGLNIHYHHNSNINPVWSRYGIRNSSAFISILLHERPEFLNRLTFCLRTDQLYYCYQGTNLWRTINDSIMKCMILEVIRPYLGIDECKKQTEILDSIYNVIVSRISCKDFTNDTLNKKYNVLVFRDCGVYDLSQRRFRPLEIEDFASVYLDWIYDQDQAERYTEAVISYLDSIFPGKDKYDFLNFLYSRLQGLPTKSILALDQHHEGLAGLLECCLGDYALGTSFGFPEEVDGYERLIIVKDQKIWNPERYSDLREITDNKCGFLSMFRTDIRNNMLHDVFGDHLKILHLNADEHDQQRWNEEWFSAFFMCIMKEYQTKEKDAQGEDEMEISSYHEKLILKNWLLSLVRPGKKYVSLGRLYRLYKSQKGSAFTFAAFGHLTRKILDAEGFAFKHRFMLANGIIVTNIFLDTAIVPL